MDFNFRFMAIVLVGQLHSRGQLSAGQLFVGQLPPRAKIIRGRSIRKISISIMCHLTYVFKSSICKSVSICRWITTDMSACWPFLDRTFFLKLSHCTFITDKHKKHRFCSIRINFLGSQQTIHSLGHFERIYNTQFSHYSRNYVTQRPTLFN